ncbi:hypothetical protein EDB89DRAFT_1906520 [Lactarius sanguifluus]|nr:hypothetical protein EDB89DRAFT_1906520 [Lactarius sanguifluus]
MRRPFAGVLQIVVNLTKPILLGNLLECRTQRSWRSIFHSIVLGGRDRSITQYFGLSLKPGNQWCFLLIREVVGKCSWNSRGSSSLMPFLLGESIAQYLTLPKVGCIVGSFTRGRWSQKGLPFLGGFLGWVLAGKRRSQEGLPREWFHDWGRRGQGVHPLGWLLGSGLLLGIVEVKKVVLLIGSVIGGVEAKRDFLLGGCSGVDYYWGSSKSRGSSS